MNINIETSTVQNTTSDELDVIAKELCGVKLTLADSGVPSRQVQNISTNGIIALTQDGVHSDAKDALLEKGITVTAATVYLRILDPEVRRVLTEVVGLGTNGKITTNEFNSLTSDRLGTAFVGNETITNFDEFKYTAITSANTYTFRDCSNLKSIDLSNLLEFTLKLFLGWNVEDMGDISNLLIVYNECISRATSDRYKTLIMPELLRTSPAGEPWYNTYGAALVPTKTEYFYAPNCLMTGDRVIGDSLKYAYLPKVLDFGGRFYTAYDGNHNRNKNSTLNILSIGESVLYVRRTVAADTANPNVAMVVHADSFELLDDHLWDYMDNDKVNSVLYKNIFVANYNLIPTRFKKVDTSVCEIGYEDWKQRMLLFAEDREFVIADQYTDFYYDYIDYLLGGIPVPDSLMNNPTTIEIHAERIGVLHDGDELCRDGNSINLKVYVNSYKNASTLELIENNAGVTLTGRVLTIPNTANGETITLRATNIYNTSLTTQVTVKVYDEGYKYVPVEDVVFDVLSWASSDGCGLTMQDLLNITELPAMCFYNNNRIKNFDALLYTSVQSLQKPAAHMFGTKGVFEDSSIESVLFPQTLTSIGEGTFYRCNNLVIENLSLPNLTELSAMAFYNTKIKTVTDLGSITSIGNSAFSGCSSLTSITIPSSVTSIGIQAFQNCSSMTSINIPNSITSIGARAFQNCSGLAVDLVIPEGVTSIEDQTFYGCSSLTSINIPESVTSIGSSAFNNCSSLTSISIPEGVTSIGAQAFNGMKYLTGDIVIPDTVTTFGSDNSNGDSFMFNGTGTSGTGVNNVTIGEGLVYLSRRCMQGMKVIGQITLPSNLQRMHYCSLDIRDSGIATVKFKGSTPPTCTNLVGLSKFAKIYVPQDSISAYQQAFSGQSGSENFVYEEYTV